MFKSRNSESSIHENIKKEIYLTLEITRKIAIDNHSTIQNLKEIANKEFSKYTSDFMLFIKDSEISNLENMNVIRTIDYYKSNVVKVIPKSNRYKINENSINQNDESNHFYQDLKRTMSNFRQKSIDSLKKSFLKNENIQIKSELDEIEDIQNDNSLKSKILENSPLKMKISNNSTLMNLKNNAYTFYESSGFRDSQKNRTNKSHILDNQTKENISQRIKNSSRTPEKTPIISNDHHELNEESSARMENLAITNKILNKSNLDLKNYVTEIENELLVYKESNKKINKMLKEIQDLKETITSLQNINDSLVSEINHAKLCNSDFISENKKLKSELELMRNSLENCDKTNYDLKEYLEGFEDINKIQQNDKRSFINTLNEKDLIIAELNERINNLDNLHRNSRKNCRDYEDIIKGLEKTIEILKNSGDNNTNNDYYKLKFLNDDLKDDLDKKTLELIEKEKIILNMRNEIEQIKKENNFLNNELSTKSRDLDINNGCLNSSNNETTKYREKLEGLNLLIIEKENSIQTMKNSLKTVNNKIEELKTENDRLKIRLNEEIIERSKLSRCKDNFDYNFGDLRKQIFDLNKLKDNLNKQNFALEEDNNELRTKIDNLKLERDRLNENIKFLNSLILQQKNEISEISEKKAAQQIEINGFNFKITEWNNLINELKTTEVSLKMQIENLTKINNSKEESIQNILNSKIELNEEIFSLKERLKNAVAEKNKAYDDYEQKNNEIIHNQSKFKIETEKYLEEIRLKDNEIQGLNRLIAEFNEKINFLSNLREKEKAEFETYLSESKRNFTGAFENEKKIKFEKEDVINEIKYKNKLIEGLTKNVDELNSNIISLKRNYDDLDSLNRGNLQKIDELGQKNDELEREVHKSKGMIENQNKLIKELKEKYDEFEKINRSLNQDVLNLKSEKSILEANNKLALERNWNLENKINSLPENKKESYYNINSPVKTKVSLLESPNRRQEDIQSNKQMKIPINIVEKEIFESQKKEENPVQTSEINLKLSKRKGEKVDILDGARLLFSIFDNKRILKFDLENRMFKLLEFADFGNFEYNYIAKGSIFLNINDGLLIVTGDNHDILYHYYHSKHIMNKMAKLNVSHNLGNLTFLENNNTVLCSSGIGTKIVEVYSNDDIFTCFMKKGKNKKQGKNKNTWSKLNELNDERSDSSFIVMELRYVYCLFGYNYTLKKYTETIEKLDLENTGLGWELIQYKNISNVSSSIKAHCLVKSNENEIIIVGGYDGENQKSVENLHLFNVKNKELYTEDKKLPMVEKYKGYSFQKNSFSVPFIDTNNRVLYAAIDEKDAVHIIEGRTLNYELFIFFD